MKFFTRHLQYISLFLCVDCFIISIIYNMDLFTLCGWWTASWLSLSLILTDLKNNKK